VHSQDVAANPRHPRCLRILVATDCGGPGLGLDASQTLMGALMIDFRRRRASGTLFPPLFPQTARTGTPMRQDRTPLPRPPFPAQLPCASVREFTPPGVPKYLP